LWRPTKPVAWVVVALDQIWLLQSALMLGSPPLLLGSVVTTILARTAVPPPPRAARSCHILTRDRREGYEWVGRRARERERLGVHLSLWWEREKELGVSSVYIFSMFGCSYQHGLSAVVQYFSLITKQPQSAYKPQKQPAE
jgi:hypothetical protein